MRAKLLRSIPRPLPLFLALACLMAACGSEDKEKTTANTPTGGASAAAATAAGGGTAAAAGKIGGKVTVLATWTGNEQDTFLAMVKPFEDQTGVKVEYEGTRDLNAILTSRV